MDTDYPLFMRRLLDRYAWLQRHDGLPGERAVVLAMLNREAEAVCREQGLPVGRGELVG